MSDLAKMKESMLDRYATKRVLINEQEYGQLSNSEKERCSFFMGDYYHNKQLSIPEEELSTFFTLKSFEAQMETKEALEAVKESQFQLVMATQNLREIIKEMKMAIVAIKNIVIFVFVLSIFSSLVLLILQMLNF